MYYTYLLQCQDGSIYTGIAADVRKRFLQHCAGKGAKYTRSHKPDKILAVFGSADRAAASRLEYYIKHLSKKDKQAIVQRQELSILADKLNVKDYTAVT